MKKGELNKEHTRIAYEIARYLKKHKALSREDFLDRFFTAKGWKGWYNRRTGKYIRPCKVYTLQSNYERFIDFLINHNIMTKAKVNGFVVFVATSKCVRIKEEKWFSK